MQPWYLSRSKDITPNSDIYILIQWIGRIHLHLVYLLYEVNNKGCHQRQPLFGQCLFSFNQKAKLAFVSLLSISKDYLNFSFTINCASNGLVVIRRALPITS